MDLKEFFKENQELTFGRYLDYILSSSSLTLEKIAEETGMSRTNLAKLKKGGRPRTNTLIKICNILLTHGLQNADISPLVFSGLNISEPQSFFLGQPYPLGYKGEYGLTSRCVLTDRIYESYYPEILDQTIRNLKKGVDYFYFLPTPRSRSELELLLLRAYERSEKDKKILRDKPYFIESPGEFIYSRFRIDNIKNPDYKVWHINGPYDKLSLVESSTGYMSDFIEFLRIMMEKAELARHKEDDTFTYPTNSAGEFKISFRILR